MLQASESQYENLDVQAAVGAMASPTPRHAVECPQCACLFDAPTRRVLRRSLLSYDLI